MGVAEKDNALSKGNIDSVIADCKQYRKQLIGYCLQYFECEL